MQGARIPRLEAKSLKAQCIETLERLIISGELAVGEVVPPERDLAKRLGVSRPVVHESMVELASKGFVSVEPRRGVRVNDFWRHGTLAIFESIVLHSDGMFPDGILADLLGFRALIELEAVRLAVLSRAAGHIDGLRGVLAEEEILPIPSGDGDGARARTELDLRFHLLLAEASGSSILPLVMNSTIPVYRSYIARFYASKPDLALVRGFHRDLVAAIAAGEGDRARSVAQAMLDHGAVIARKEASTRAGAFD